VSWAIRYRLLCTRSGDYELVALFLADLLADRPSGPKEPSVAWGYTHRVLVSAQLGRRQSHADWLDLGHDHLRRGLRHTLAGGQPSCTRPDQSHTTLPTWDRMAEPIRISSADAEARVDAGQAIVLDVVTSQAWDQIDVAIAGAVRIPPDMLESHLSELPKDRDLIAYCT
jgi:hypothetical protein